MFWFSQQDIMFLTGYFLGIRKRKSRNSFLCYVFSILFVDGFGDRDLFSEQFLVEERFSCGFSLVLVKRIESKAGEVDGVRGIVEFFLVQARLVWEVQQVYFYLKQRGSWDFQQDGSGYESDGVVLLFMSGFVVRVFSEDEVLVQQESKYWQRGVLERFVFFQILFEKSVFVQINLVLSEFYFYFLQVGIRGYGEVLGRVGWYLGFWLVW